MGRHVELYSKNPTEQILGIYRHGSTHSTYLHQDIDMSTVMHHEHAHHSLAASTTAGYLHNMLVYISVESKSTMWEKATKAAISMSLNTHESLATYTGLLLSSNYLDDNDKLYEVHRLPEMYQKFYENFDTLIPKDCSVSDKLAISFSIASYAMNVSIEDLCKSPYEDIESGNGDFPKVDDRFAKILKYLHRNPNILLEIIRRLSPYDSIGEPSDEDIVDYYARRRKLHYQRITEAKNILSRYLPEINLRDGLLDKDYTSEGSVLLDSWRKDLERHDVNILDNFSRIDDGGIHELDPLLFEGKVVIPNRQISGLVRISNTSELPRKPSFAYITHARWDCELSSSLSLRRGQYYARYYYIDNEGDFSDYVYYYLENDKPDFVETINISVRKFSKIPDNLSSESKNESTYLLLTSSGFDLEFLYSILSSNNPEVCWFEWEGFENILILSVFYPEKNLFLFSLATKETAPTDIAYRILKPLCPPRPSEIHARFMKYLHPNLDLMFPSEGVAL